MSATTIWDQILTLIEGKVGPHSFSTWFKPTTLKSDQGRLLVIGVPAPLYVEWLPRHYSVVLAEALGEIGRPQVQLVFEVAAPEDAPPTPPTPLPVFSSPGAVALEAPPGHDLAPPPASGSEPSPRTVSHRTAGWRR